MAKSLLLDFPSSPLDRYRNQSNFDWKDMKIFIQQEDAIICTHKLVEILQSYTICTTPITNLNLNEEKYTATKRMLLFIQENFINESDTSTLQRRTIFKNLICWDPATTIKYFHCIYNGMTIQAIKTMGTERHNIYVKDSLEGKILGCFCLTEIGHGSNTRAMGTTATYDSKTEEFILNTPNFESAKCWAASLAKTATYALIYAQLITPDGVNHGLHIFLVDIRDRKSFLSFPGITLGEMGAKAGLNGIDNGYIIFNNYRIPRERLLNRISDVTPDGKYIMTLKDPSKRLGLSLQAISSARIGIVHVCAANLSKAVTIAIRYAAIRKQFGNENGDELPILEYQLTQLRVLPHLATCYILNIFSNHYLPNIEGISKTDDLLIELHAITSAGKSVAGWIVRNCLQDCYHVCAGHGYLKISELSDIRNNHDANLSYDGENNVLCQQASNWLMKCWKNYVDGKKLPTSPLLSINFLYDAENILKMKFTAKTIEETICPTSIINAYKWLNCYLMQQSYEKLANFMMQGDNLFTAKNNTQVFHLRTLSIVYFEHYVIERTYEIIKKCENRVLREHLIDLLSLFGIWSLNQHMLEFYQGCYAEGPNFSEMIKEGILRLFEKIKPNAVSLVDAIAPHDFFISSPLGASDGQMYKRLENAFLHVQDAFMQTEDWRQYLDKPLQHKL